MLSRFFKQIVDAVAFMHNRGVIHRDLKLSNILLNREETDVKIIDFGNSFSSFSLSTEQCITAGISEVEKSEDILSDFVGSAAFAAPEILSGAGPYAGRTAD